MTGAQQRFCYMRIGGTAIEGNVDFKTVNPAAGGAVRCRPFNQVGRIACGDYAAYRTGNGYNRVFRILTGRGRQI